MVTDTSSQNTVQRSGWRVKDTVFFFNLQVCLLEEKDT